MYYHSTNCARFCVQPSIDPKSSSLLNDDTVKVINGSLLIKPPPKSFTATHPLYVTQLKACVKSIIGDNVGQLELRDFYKNLDIFIFDATCASNPLSFNFLERW